MYTQESLNESLKDCLARRKALLWSLLEKKYPDRSGVIVLFAPVEHEYEFLQDSSFFYCTGLTQPSIVIACYKDGSTILFQPDNPMRAQWMDTKDMIDQNNKNDFDINRLEKLGKLIHGYSIYSYFAASDYDHVIEFLTDLIKKEQTIFTVYPKHVRHGAAVKQVIDRLAQFVPQLLDHIEDISDLIAQLRRKKDNYEIEMLHEAIAVTADAFLAAEHMIKPGATEAQVHAAINYIFIEQHARPAYHPIVASGKNATILHYNTNSAPLKSGDLLLIDAGAMVSHYCADITRMYAVSKKMTSEQKKIYDILLEVQAHVAAHTKPGVWINNPQFPEASLQHIAIEFLKRHDLHTYFSHAIGHFLGLDTHDVGDRTLPLQEGDVITIEPGIYIPEKNIGLRIEDDYWIVADDALCLSENIHK